ncbi:hypothetical protein [Actinokineospora enzanensis]|uniref:hypothetical protein n=1 Tax=Actinokineospora enzanensis TaxID=155975 RepID=UPI0012EC88ED|nr:hypothetical protein [Actinokineospora enzanensis]
MRGAVRRGRPGVRAVITLACAAALVAGCSNEVPGAAVPAPITPPTVSDAALQAARDLAEAGLLRFKGTLTAASGDLVGFDVAAASSGEIAGSMTINDKPTQLLVVGGGIYLKAAAEFWASLSGVANGQNKGTAVADRWVKVPGGLIGMEPADVFTPVALGQSVLVDGDKAADPVDKAERSDLAGAKVVKVPLARGTAYLADAAPHGLLKVELDSVGKADATKVKQLTGTVADGTADLAKFYQDVAAQAGELTAPVDVLTTVQEGEHTFEGCGAASCTIVVNFTNGGKAAVKVSVRGRWIGDNAPLGNCESQAGPVAPGQPGSAKCTVATPEWVQFFARANSVPGNHPYSVEWSTVVLADAPDLAAVTALAKAAPASAQNKQAEGSHYVYAIVFGQQVFKYGVVAGKFWSDTAGQQLNYCLGATGSVCRVDLVTATGDAASAQGLLKQLVDTYRNAKGQCPPAQWVGCAR